MVDLRAQGFITPSEVYEMDDEEDDIMLNEDIARIRTEMERHRQRQQEAQQASSSTARSDLDELIVNHYLLVCQSIQWQQMKKMLCLH